MLCAEKTHPFGVGFDFIFYFSNISLSNIAGLVYCLSCNKVRARWMSFKI